MQTYSGLHIANLQRTKRLIITGTSCQRCGRGIVGVANGVDSIKELEVKLQTRDFNLESLYTLHIGSSQLQAWEEYNEVLIRSKRLNKPRQCWSFDGYNEYGAVRSIPCAGYFMTGNAAIVLQYQRLPMRLPWGIVMVAGSGTRQVD